MRVLLLLLLLAGLGFYFGMRLRGRDPLASVILFVFSGIMVSAWLGAFFGWFGG